MAPPARKPTEHALPLVAVPVVETESLRENRKVEGIQRQSAAAADVIAVVAINAKKAALALMSPTTRHAQPQRKVCGPYAGGYTQPRDTFKPLTSR